MSNNQLRTLIKEYCELRKFRILGAKSRVISFRVIWRLNFSNYLSREQKARSAPCAQSAFQAKVFIIRLICFEQNATKTWFSILFFMVGYFCISHGNRRKRAADRQKYDGVSERFSVYYERILANLHTCLFIYTSHWCVCVCP